MFGRLGRFCFHHRWSVLISWIVLIVALGAAGQAVGTDTKTAFGIPGAESQRGLDILKKGFGGKAAGFTGTVVFVADDGVNSPAVKAGMEKFFATIESDKTKGISQIQVASPYAPKGARQISSKGALANKLAYATVNIPAETTQDDVLPFSKQVKKDLPHIKGVRIELGGDVFAGFDAPSSELLGIGSAIIILIFAFGSVVAMGLPLGVAIAGIGFGTILAGLISNLVPQPSFAATLGVMIGLGVGIDYALFIVTRFRENLHTGHSVEDSIAIALDTAGRAVCFAGTTVVISLLGMLVMRIGFINGLAVGAATVVFATMIASLTLLPALLGAIGEKVEITRWRGLIMAVSIAVAIFAMGLKLPVVGIIGGVVALLTLLASLAYEPLRDSGPEPKHPQIRDTPAYKWSRLIQGHPWLAFVTGALALLILAVPVFSLQLGFSDNGNAPKATSTRQAYDLLGRGFGPGSNGPLLLATTLAHGADQKAFDKVTNTLNKTPGVQFASPAITNNPTQPTVAQWTVVPTTSPQNAKTAHLVHQLRDVVLPAATAGTGLNIAVTGSVAVNIDFSSYLAARLPYFFGLVLILSFVLLMVVFRSILVPLKAVIMNLLSIGAAYGIIVAAFQWGWAGKLLNIDSAPIEPFIPMMLFAIVFGLSMDYEVFLLSRVKEEFDRTGDSHASVADGLAVTAKVITAAALIMVFVFGSFLFEKDRIIKLFGAGLSVAVLLDATIVRMVMVPATMELLGDKNWWIPKWLDKILPHIDIEGHAETEDHIDVDSPSKEPAMATLDAN